MAISLGAVFWVVWVVTSTLLQAGVGNPIEGDLRVETTTPVPEDKPKLLFIVLGGFRWDYLDRQRPENLPGFTRFLRKGVKARWTEPVFPTVSFPAWTTLFTGLYAENHGVVGNYFYDSKTKDVFSLSDPPTTSNAKWWTAEPIWTTAEKANLKTSQYLISRCDVPFDDVLTHKCEPYTDNLKRDNLVKHVMKAVENFEDGYDFVQVYTVHVDEMGHMHGPDSEEVHRAVRDVDTAISVLLDELEDRQLDDKVNIVIASDHGMADTSERAVRTIDLDRHVNFNHVENIADYGAFMNIKTVDGYSRMVYESLRHIPGISVYRKEDIPESFHYKEGEYVHDIVLVAEAGNFIEPSSSNKQLPLVRFTMPAGSHGYAVDVPSMRGVFFAKGPAFVERTTINPIHMVDIYQVLTNVLEILPRPHNGTWWRVAPAFKSSHRYPKEPNSGIALLSSIVWTVLFVILARYLE